MLSKLARVSRIGGFEPQQWLRVIYSTLEGKAEPITRRIVSAADSAKLTSSKRVGFQFSRVLG